MTCGEPVIPHNGGVVPTTAGFVHTTPFAPGTYDYRRKADKWGGSPTVSAVVIFSVWILRYLTILMNLIAVDKNFVTIG